MLSPLAAVLDPNDVGRKNDLLHAIQLRRLLGVLDDVKGKRVLDFGAGTGRLCRALTSRGAQVFGLDSSEPMTRVAVSLAPSIPVVVGDGGRCIRRHSVDIVTSVMVLQYFDPASELGHAVRSLAELLRPGGRLVMLEQVRESGLDRGATADQYVAALTTAGLRVTSTRRVRRSDSRLLGRATRLPLLDRWLPLLSAIEARVDRRPLTGGKYADVLFVAKAQVS